MEYLFITLAYVVPTFPLAFFWHMKIFEATYRSWDYFDDNPSPPIGLASMLVQGVAVSAGYIWLAPQVNTEYFAYWYVLLIAVIHWSVHVLAAMAKNPAMRTSGYVAMETIFLTLQFGIFAVLLQQLF